MRLIQYKGSKPGVPQAGFCAIIRRLKKEGLGFSLIFCHTFSWILWEISSSPNEPSLGLSPCALHYTNIYTFFAG